MRRVGYAALGAMAMLVITAALFAVSVLAGTLFGWLGLGPVGKVLALGALMLVGVGAGWGWNAGGRP